MLQLPLPIPFSIPLALCFLVELPLLRQSETYKATATPLTGEERDRLYAKQAELWVQFADYQRKTSRKIPVVALERQKD